MISFKNETPAMFKLFYFFQVIQRRIDGSVDFYLSFDEFVNGFGDKRTEYWLGKIFFRDLEKIENAVILSI